MRHHRTPQSPLFEVTRPLSQKWQWVVQYNVASSGYPTSCHVTAAHGSGEEYIAGTAMCDVHVGDDLKEVIECLAIESMMAACEPTITGETPLRRVVFSSNL